MTIKVRPQSQRRGRRRLALAGALVALALPALSACGSFDYATDRPNVIADGGYDLDSPVRVNAARIVTPREGEGVFIATFVNNPEVYAPTSGAELPQITGIAVRDGSSATLTPTSFSPLKLGDNGILSLADPATGGVAVTGDFKPGDMVPLTITFSEGEPANVQVPVVTQCGPYADVVSSDEVAAAAAPSEAPAAPGKPGGKKKGPQAPAATPTPTEAAEPGPAYSCDYPEAELPGSEDK